MIRLFARILCFPMMLLLVSAAPAARTIPHPGGGPALIIPAGSPVKFRNFDKNGAAHFDGQFVVRGTFTLNCELCEPPTTVDDITFYVVPDPELARRMPHWADRGDRMAIEINNSARLRRSIVSSHQLAGLVSGKIAEVKGRISIVVDRFVADFGCDYSPYYSARFVKLAKPAKLARLKIDGDFGCA